MPKEFAILMTTFAPLCTQQVWQHVHGLLVWAMLAPGKRSVLDSNNPPGPARYSPARPGTSAMWTATVSATRGQSTDTRVTAPKAATAPPPATATREMYLEQERPRSRDW